MSHESRPPDGREQEIARLLDGELGALEFEQLAKLLESDSDLRKTYLDHVAMQAMLQWQFSRNIWAYLGHESRPTAPGGVAKLGYANSLPRCRRH